jgi:hypothetical protein
MLIDRASQVQEDDDESVRGTRPAEGARWTAGGVQEASGWMMRRAREKDTGTLAYDWFLSEDGTECEVREAYVDADALVEHASHVREARDVLFAEFAYDHKMAFYGDPSPRLVELVDKVGVDVTYFTLLQAFEPATVH